MHRAGPHIRKKNELLVFKVEEKKNGNTTNMKTLEKEKIEGFAIIKLKTSEKNDDEIPIFSIKVICNEEANEKQWQAVQEIIDKYKMRVDKCRMLIDLTETKLVFTMQYMQKWISFFRSNKQYLRDRALFVAFVSENTVFKKLLQIALVTSKPVVPFFVIESKRDMKNIQY